MSDPIKMLFEHNERVDAINAAVERQEKGEDTKADRVLLAYDIAMNHALCEIEDLEERL